MYAQKNCVLNASEHVYNLVCDLKINTHGNMPKKSAHLPEQENSYTPACIRLGTQPFMGQDAGPWCRISLLLVGPTGQRGRELGNVLPAIDRSLGGESQPGI